jgi:hypothetical protein
MAGLDDPQHAHAHLIATRIAMRIFPRVEFNRVERLLNISSQVKQPRNGNRSAANVVDIAPSHALALDYCRDKVFFRWRFCLTLAGSPSGLNGQLMWCHGGRLSAGSRQRMSSAQPAASMKSFSSRSAVRECARRYDRSNNRTNLM